MSDQRRPARQRTRRIARVEKVESLCQAVAQCGPIAEVLPGNSLLGHRLMASLDHRVLRRRHLVDEPHLDAKGDEPQMKDRGKRRETDIVVEDAIMIQTNPLWQAILDESPTQDQLMVLGAGMRRVQTGKGESFPLSPG